MMASSDTLAFFGATGGCALACLVRSLNAGLQCRALARTPSKLTSLLLEKGVSEATIDRLLTVVQGAAQEEAAVRQVLQSSDGDLVQRVIFGIGGAPAFGYNPLRLFITLDDPTVCQSSMASILHVVERLPYTTKPLFCAISTTGISSQRDVPYALLPLYRWLLHVPHVDKLEMEKHLLAAHSRGIVGGVVILKPSLLTDGPAEEQRVRWGEAPKHPIGYTISRESVGAWLFSDLVQRDNRAWGMNESRVVSLTY